MRVGWGAGLMVWRWAQIGLILGGTLASAYWTAWAVDPFLNPNLLVDKTRLEYIQSSLTKEDQVLSAAYSALMSRASTYLRRDPNPICGELRVPRFYRNAEAQQAVARRIQDDSKAVHTLALAYALSRDPAYGKKAKTFLLAWVNCLKGAVDGGDLLDRLIGRGEGDTPIVIAYTFPNFIYAYDLLKGSGALTDEEALRFQLWLPPFVAYHMAEERLRNNHLSWQVVFLMAAAHALRDRELFERAIQYYRSGLRSQIGQEGSSSMR